MSLKTLSKYTLAELVCECLDWTKDFADEGLLYEESYVLLTADFCAGGFFTAVGCLEAVLDSLGMGFFTEGWVDCLTDESERK